MKKIAIIVISAFMSIVSINAMAADQAVPATTAAATAAPKIAVVNIQQILQASPIVKKASEQLQSEFKVRADKLKTDKAAVEADAQKLQRDGSVMSAADKKALQDKVATAQEAFMKEYNTYQTDVSAAQTSSLKSVFEDLNKIIQAQAKANHYDLVLDSQSVAFADASINITKQVLDAFNASKS